MIEVRGIESANPGMEEIHCKTYLESLLHNCVVAH